VKTARSDARRNRARIVAAAGAVFAEQGVDASLDRVIERAGVGVGTLYRHFPRREALVDALFEERADDVVAALEAALESGEAAVAFERFVAVLVTLQRGDRVLKELLTRYPPDEPLASRLRGRIERLSERLLERAREQGLLRADFTRGDLALLVWSLGPVLEATSEVAPEAWRRHLGFVIDGLSPRAASPAPVPPLSEQELAASMRALRAARFPRGPSPERSLSA
jgi:AcrR family transcriptional regulator